MLGRQEALDLQKNLRAVPADERKARVNLGPANALDIDAVYAIELERDRFNVHALEGDWIAYAAQCPHMLAPLSRDAIAEGQITCGWHGYRFDLTSGHEEHGRCGNLKLATCTVDPAGDLIAALS